jgi:hypothetical protein
MSDAASPRDPASAMLTRKLAVNILTKQRSDQHLDVSGGRHRSCQKSVQNVQGQITEERQLSENAARQSTEGAGREQKVWFRAVRMQFQDINFGNPRADLFPGQTSLG